MSSFEPELLDASTVLVSASLVIYAGFLCILWEVGNFGQCTHLMITIAIHSTGSLCTAITMAVNAVLVAIMSGFMDRLGGISFGKS